MIFNTAIITLSLVANAVESPRDPQEGIAAATTQSFDADGTAINNLLQFPETPGATIELQECSWGEIRCLENALPSDAFINLGQTVLGHLRFPIGDPVVSIEWMLVDLKNSTRVILSSIQVDGTSEMNSLGDASNLAIPETICKKCQFQALVQFESGNSTLFASSLFKVLGPVIGVELGNPIDGSAPDLSIDIQDHLGRSNLSAGGCSMQVSGNSNGNGLWSILAIGFLLIAAVRSLFALSHTPTA